METFSPQPAELETPLFTEKIQTQHPDVYDPYREPITYTEKDQVVLRNAFAQARGEINQLPDVDRTREHLDNLMAARPDLKQHMHVVFEQYRPILYDTLMKTYRRAAEGSLPDQQLFMSIVQMCAAYNIETTDMLQEQAVETEAPLFSNELMNIAEVWHEVRIETRQVIDTAEGSEGKARTAPFVAVSVDLLSFFDVSRNVDDASPAEARLAADMSQFGRAFFETLSNGMRTIPMEFYRELSQDDFIQLQALSAANKDTIGASVFHGARLDRSTLEKLPQEVRNQFEQATKLNNFITPEDTVSNFIHGWMGDLRFGQMLVPQMVHEAGGVGITGTYWGMNGNAVDHPDYTGKPLSNRDLGRILKYQLDILGVLGNPGIKVLERGWSRGGMAVQECLIEIMRYLDSQLGVLPPEADIDQSLKIPEAKLREVAQGMARIMALLEEPARPGTTDFVTNLEGLLNLKDVNARSLVLKLVSGSFVNLGHMLNELRIAQIPGIKEIVQKLTGEYTGVMLPQDTSEERMAGEVHAVNFNDERNRHVARRLTAGMTKAQAQTPEDIASMRRAQQELCSAIIEVYGLRDLLVNPHKLLMMQKEFAKSGYIPLVLTVDTGHTGPLSDECKMLPWEILSQLQPGEGKVVEEVLRLVQRFKEKKLTSTEAEAPVAQIAKLVDVPTFEEPVVHKGRLAKATALFRPKKEVIDEEKQEKERLQAYLQGMSMEMMVETMFDGHLDKIYIFKKLLHHILQNNTIRSINEPVTDQLRPPQMITVPAVSRPLVKAVGGD